MDNQIATYGNVWWNNGRCLGSGRRRTTCSCWLWGSQVTRSTLAYLRNSFSKCVIHSLIHLGLAWQQHADQYFVFIYSPHLWLLKFNPAVVNDSGTYLCHVATDPPLIRYVQLQISGKQFVFPLLPLSLSLSPFSISYTQYVITWNFCNPHPSVKYEEKRVKFIISWRRAKLRAIPKFL